MRQRPRGPVSAHYPLGPEKDQGQRRSKRNWKLGGSITTRRTSAPPGGQRGLESEPSGVAEGSAGADRARLGDIA